jgi:hypothetical protein
MIESNLPAHDDNLETIGLAAPAVIEIDFANQEAAPVRTAVAMDFDGNPALVQQAKLEIEQVIGDIPTKFREFAALALSAPSRESLTASLGIPDEILPEVAGSALRHLSRAVKEQPVATAFLKQLATRYCAS